MTEKLLKYKYLYIALLTILVIAALLKAPFIQVDTDISQFFNEDDTDYSFYQEMKAEFSSQENLIVLGVKSQDSIFVSRFLNQIVTLTDSIKKTPNIKKVNSLLNLSYPIKSAFGIIGIPYVNRKENGQFDYNKIKILNDELPKIFVNKKGNALFLWIETEENLDAKNLETLISSLNRLRTESKELTTFLWGRKVVDLSFNDILIKETLAFGFWIFLFLCLSFGGVRRTLFLNVLKEPASAKL